MSPKSHRHQAFIKTRKFWLAIGAAAAVLLGAEKLGVSQVAPGPDLNVTWASAATTSGLHVAVAKDAGDVTSWVRLAAVSSTTLTAAECYLSNGTRLVSTVTTTSVPGSHLFEIGIPPVPGLTGVQPFVWPVGTAINVIIPAASLEITDWEVFTSAEGSDSLAKSRLRRYWNWGLLGLLALAALGAALGVAGSTPSAPVTAHGCVMGIIDTMDSDEKGKVFLRKLLVERSSLDEALDAAAVPTVQRLRFIIKTQKAFRARLGFLVDDLRGYLAFLP